MFVNIAVNFVFFLLEIDHIHDHGRNCDFFLKCILQFYNIIQKYLFYIDKCQIFKIPITTLEFHIWIL